MPEAPKTGRKLLLWKLHIEVMSYTLHHFQIVETGDAGYIVAEQAEPWEILDEDYCVSAADKIPATYEHPAGYHLGIAVGRLVPGDHQRTYRSRDHAPSRRSAWLETSTSSSARSLAVPA
jgi:hypothetical protein